MMESLATIANTKFVACFQQKSMLSEWFINRMNEFDVFKLMIYYLIGVSDFVRLLSLPAI